MNLVTRKRTLILTFILLFACELQLTTAKDVNVWVKTFGDDTTLTCTETNPKWKKDKIELPKPSDKYELEGDNLKIISIQNEDLGSYSCGNTSSFILQKADAPTFIKELSSSRIIPSKGVISLTCAVKSKPKSQMKWFFNNDKITSGGQDFSIVSNTVRDVVSSTLTKDRAIIEDNGNFSCRVSNESTNEVLLSSTIQIKILALYFKRAPNPKYIIPNGNLLKIESKVTGYPLPMSVSWKINNTDVTLLEDTRIYQNNTMVGTFTLYSVLVINKVLYKDSGDIKFTCHNAFENISATSTLQVLEYPEAVIFGEFAPSYKTLFFQWSYPRPEKDRTNDIIFKVVTTSVEGSLSKELKNSSIKLEGLTMNQKYQICVRAMLAGLSGPSNCRNVSTLEFQFGNMTLSTNQINARNISIRLNEHMLDKQIPGYFVSIEVFEDKNLVAKKNVTDAENLQVFAGLQPYTSYTFKATENFAGVNSGISELQGIITLQAAPSAPTNIGLANIGKDSFTVTWNEPAEKNGKLTEYRVTYSYMKLTEEVSNSTIVPVRSRQTFTFTNLYSFVEYKIEIQAKTVEYGPAAPKTVKTSEDVPAAPSGVTFVSITARSILVKWNQIPNYLRGGELTNYRISLKSSKEDNTTTQSMNATITQVALKNLIPDTGYTFTIQALTKDFDGKITTKPVKTEEAPPSKPTDVKVIPERQEVTKGGKVYHFMLVKWNAPVQANGKILGFDIRYWKIKSSRRRRNIELKNVEGPYTGTPGPSNREFTISDLEPFTEYGVQVREKTNGGWGEYSEAVEKSTKQGNPSKPTNVTYSDLTSNSITISWEVPQEPNGHISRYSILIKQGGIVKKDMEFNQQQSTSVMVATVRELESKSTYQIELAAVINDEDELIGERYILQFTTPEAPAGFPWHFVLIGCLATVLLLALVIAIFLLMNRRKGKYQEVRRQADQLDLKAINKSKLIAVPELKNYCVQQHANSDHGFQQEFDSVRIPVHTFTWEHSQMPYNQSKNRYSNIVAYDHSRVILNQIESDPCSTYINANYVNGYQHPKKFIAAQGPLPETVLDFWRMIWEQNTPIIVMLTKCVEDNKIKCEQYWPEGKALQYKDIVVTVSSVSEMTDYIVRVFTLHKINNPELGKREVRQYHYKSWPDHGCPAHPTSMLSFVRHVMSYMNNRRQDGPIVVHCSAGVGRTGTFIAIESNLRQLEHDQSVDVYGTVCRMRMQRNFMVQIEAQYTFIYDALLDSVVCGNTEATPSELKAKIRFLNLVEQKTGKTNFHEEFKRLESGIPTESSFTDASHPENKQKNRYLNILPYDHNRVKLVPIAGSRQSDYINASIIDGYQQKNAFIATQAPLENTVTDFWRMVQEKNIHIIVMLTKLVEKEQEKCYLYWPQAGTVSYGAIYVELVNVRQEEENITVHELRLTNRETGKSWPVQHFMYNGWPDTGSPSSGIEFINLIAHVQREQSKIQDSGPTLVHCSGGSGRSGAFIGTFNSIEKLRSSDVVDIFQTVRQLRLQRVAMVQTLDQYIFCYSAVKDYLDSFDHYTNPKL